MSISAHAQRGGRSRNDLADAETESRAGTELTRQGHYQEAIPHLVAARRQAQSYVTDFNLALCYIATEQFPQAIAILDELRRDHDTADVENLLAQAHIGAGDTAKALASFQRAAAITPTNEKLYLFVADACMAAAEYELGVKVVDIGLHNLPQSARLHYERGVFLSSLDDFDNAKPSFDEAAKLGAGGSIGYVATAHKNLIAGDVEAAISAAREGVKKGQKDYLLFALLGDALLRAGASPGQPEFKEAQDALEKSVALRAGFADSQLALGKLYLLASRADDAVTHLELAGQLTPRNPSVYSNLANAYRRRGDNERAQMALQELARLNAEQKAKISEAPGERKAGYSGRVHP